MSWAAVLAVFLVLLALGKFVDDFHSTQVWKGYDRLKSRIQLLLTRAFVLVYSVAIPDVPMWICLRIFDANRKLGLKMVVRAGAIYFLILILLWTFVFLISRRVLNIPVTIILFMPTISLVLFLTITLPSGNVFVRWLRDKSLVTQRLFMPLFILIITSIFNYCIYIFLIMINPSLSDPRSVLYLDLERPAGMLAAASGFSVISMMIEPTLLILLTVILLTFIVALLEITRISLLLVSEGASDPTKSPFAYFFGLIGVLILLAKAVGELIVPVAHVAP